MANPSISPESVVSKYCQLDFEGARLSSSTWVKSSHLITWEEEPGWDLVVPIKNFKIIATSQKNSRAAVRVQYELEKEAHGIKPDNLIYIQNIVDFRLIKNGDTWKINGPKIYPHVSVEVLKKK